MPAATRVGDKSTGHDNCQPVSAVEGSKNTFINGKPAVLVGDKYASHGCLVHTPHQGHLAEGSSACFINGRAVGRVGDAISCGGTVAEGSGNVFIGNGNEQKLNKALFHRKEVTTRYKRRQEDDIFFCLPLIAEAMGNKANEKDRIGWHYLRDMFYKWLAGEANADAKANPTPFWVDIDWVLSYEKAKEQWEKAISERILNENAHKEIKAHLLELGYIAEKRTEFDFINIPYSEWDENHYQHMPVDFDTFDLIAEAFKNFTGLFVALGSFTFKFLAKGTITYTENDFEIEIEQVAGFVHDTFNFESSGNAYKDKLGFWNCENKQMNIYDFYNGVYMDNAKFRDFREHNKIGNDFVVLSKQKLIDIQDIK